MRRRSVHLMFGAAVLVCAGIAGYEAFRLQEASRSNEAVARATQAPDSADAALLGTLPEAQFAQAVVLAKQGQYDQAIERYKAVIRGTRADLAIDALMLPLIELAKQSYRTALRRDPARWDVRYNLERALWLAPELDESLSLSVPRNAEDRVMSTLQSTRGDLP